MSLKTLFLKTLFIYKIRGFYNKSSNKDFIYSILLGIDMATGFLRKLALPGLALSSILVPVLAQESQPGSFGAIPAPSMEALTNGLGYIFGEPTGTTAELLTIKFLIFLAIMTIFSVFLDKTQLFKEKKYVAVILGLIFALIGVRFVPRDAVMTLAGTLGASISTALVLAVPAAIIYFSWSMTPDKSPHKWTALGAGCAVSGALLLTGNVTSLSIVRVFSGASLLSWVVGIALIVLGLILLLHKSRIWALSKVSQNTKTQVLYESRDFLKDAMYETGVSRRAIVALRDIELMMNHIPPTQLVVDLATPGTSELKQYEKFVKVLQKDISLETRENKGMMADLRAEINALHHPNTNHATTPPTAATGTPLQTVWHQLNSAYQDLETLYTDENDAFSQVKFLTSAIGQVVQKSLIKLAAQKAYQWFENEQIALKKVESLITQIEGEVESSAF